MPKRVCVVGKYPPIQGGTSSHTYWACRAMASQGFEVHVVSNSTETEANLAYVLLDEDHAFVSLDGIGSCTVHSTTPVPIQSFIPFAKPYCSQLLGLANDVIESRRFDAILGWYLEPYGLVASIVGRLHDVPVFLRHAGSDIGRLIDYPNLNASARMALAPPTRVLTRPGNVQTFLNLGVPRERILDFRPPRLPEYHLGSVPTCDLTRYHQRFGDWAEAALEPGLSERLLKGSAESLAAGPRIAVFGKVSKHKGSAAILAALSQPGFEAIDFQFLPIALGKRNNLTTFFRTLASSQELLPKTFLLPPIPPWRIPGFLRQVDAAIYLEDQFPVAQHSPITVREILASGACLVCSRETIDKSILKNRLVDGVNVVVVENPSDRTEIVSLFKTVLCDTEQTQRIGRAGKLLSDMVEAELSSTHPLVTLFNELPDRQLLDC